MLIGFLQHWQGSSNYDLLFARLTCAEQNLIPYLSGSVTGRVVGSATDSFSIFLRCFISQKPWGIMLSSHRDRNINECPQNAGFHLSFCSAAVEGSDKYRLSCNRDDKQTSPLTFHHWLRPFGLRGDDGSPWTTSASSAKQNDLRTPYPSSGSTFTERFCFSLFLFLQIQDTKWKIPTITMTEQAGRQCLCIPRIFFHNERWSRYLRTEEDARKWSRITSEYFYWLSQYEGGSRYWSSMAGRRTRMKPIGNTFCFKSHVNGSDACYTNYNAQAFEILISSKGEADRGKERVSWDQSRDGLIIVEPNWWMSLF